MDRLDLGTITGLILAGVALFLPAWGLAVMRRRRRLARTEAAAPPAPAAAARGRLRLGGSTARLAALEAVQAALAARLETLATTGSEPEARLRSLAGQLLELIRDKNAGFETALAGLDQLRGRLRALEEVGTLPEARAAADRLDARISELQAAQATGAAALEARIAGMETRDARSFADLVAEIARIYDRKDAALAAMLDRLAPLEARLAELGGAPATLDRLDTRLGQLETVQAAAAAELAALRAQVGALEADAAGRAVAASAIGSLEARLATVEQGLRARIDALDWAQEELAERVVAAAPAPVPGAARPRPAVALRVVPSAAEMEEVWSLPQLVSLHRR